MMMIVYYKPSAGISSQGHGASVALQSLKRKFQPAKIVNWGHAEISTSVLSGLALSLLALWNWGVRGQDHQ
jgi:hypothetical protein